jgi:copper(I)-binding protein
VIGAPAAHRAPLGAAWMATLAAVCSLGACSGDDDDRATSEIVDAGMAVTDAWARPTAPGIDTGAIYVAVENRDAPDDRIVAASAPDQCATIVPHQTVVDDNGVASMPGILGDELFLPVGGSVRMEPLGLHLMCLGMGGPLADGDRFELTIEFDVHEAMTFDVTVDGDR